MARAKALDAKMVLSAMLIIYFLLKLSEITLYTDTRNELRVDRIPPKRIEAPAKVGQQGTLLGVDCRRVIEGDRSEVDRVSRQFRDYRPQTDDELRRLTRNCTQFRLKKRYILHPVSEEERDYPIAYSILLYKDVSQAELLLRAIYRPQNAYCIHVDRDAHYSVRRLVQSIAACFDNVRMTSKPERITYAGFTRLQADVTCMKDMLASQTRWRYYINLASQAFPLKTNAEIVKILKVYNGANDVEGISEPRRMIQFRYKMHHELSMQPDGKAKLITTNVTKAPAPHSFNVVKGSAYGVFSRGMVDYIVNDRRARDLLEWSRDVKSPDEYFWATLNHNPDLAVPGSYRGSPDSKPWLASFAAWCCKEECHGFWVRGVCVFGIGDLPYLTSKKELFANKFYLHYQPVTLHCLAEWLWNKTFSPLPFNLYYYRNLKFVNPNQKSSLVTKPTK